MDQKTCKTCDETKPVAEFAWYAPGKYRSVCRKCYSAQQTPKMKTYYAANSERIKVERKAFRAYRKEHGLPEQRLKRPEDYDEKRRATGKARRIRYRAKCFDAYGGSFCACCGESTIEFLTLDHINGDGGALRRSGVENAGERLYRKLELAGYPPGYQVLCMNCNWARRHDGICPHQR
jgi:hypothetical protein